MDVRVFGEDSFGDVLAAIEPGTPGFTAEFEGTVSMIRHRGRVGRPIGNSPDDLFTFLYGTAGQKIGVVVTSVDRSPGSIDVEIVDVCTYEQWIGGREQSIRKRLGLD